MLLRCQAPNSNLGLGYVYGLFCGGRVKRLDTIGNGCDANHRLNLEETLRLHILI